MVQEWHEQADVQRHVRLFMHFIDHLSTVLSAHLAEGDDWSINVELAG